MKFEGVVGIIWLRMEVTGGLFRMSVFYNMRGILAFTNKLLLLEKDSTARR